MGENLHGRKGENLMRELKLYPNDCLRAENEEVVKFDKGLREIVNDMKDIMGRSVGIAAPQIGVNKKIVVVHFNKYYVLINPKIEITGKHDFTYTEECLSLPGEKVTINRPDYVRVSFQDIKGEPQQLAFEYFFSQALQHELDHLEGKLIIDYAIEPVTKETIETLKRGEDI